MIYPKHISSIVASVPTFVYKKRRLTRFFYWSPWILQHSIWPIVRPLFLLFIHLDIRGAEHLTALDPKSRGVIFAVSHSSELDSILVPAALPFLSPFLPMFYTSREWTFYKTSGWRRYFSHVVLRISHAQTHGASCVWQTALFSRPFLQ